MNDPNSIDQPFPGWDELVAVGDVAGLRPEVLAAARMAVADAVRRDTGTTAVGDSATAVGDSATAVGDEGVVVPLATPKRPRRMTLRLTLMGLAAAVAAIAIVPLSASNHPPHPAGSDASLFLTDVASVQSIQTGTWGSAPYWKVSLTRALANGTRAGSGTELLAHHAGLTSHLLTTFPERQDKTVPGPWRFSVGTRNLTWDQLAGLPTSSAALRALLKSYADPAGDSSQEVFATIGDLLVSPAPPKVRGALFQVAAGLPGVRLVGKGTDGSGRPGSVVERSDGTVVIRYLIDSTGRLLETVVSTVQALPAVPASTTPQPLSGLNDVSQGRGADAGRTALPAGAVLERTTYTSVGPATSTD